jgi:phosphatidylglycerol:prolipoprotein diacylglycerol transferase
MNAFILFSLLVAFGIVLFFLWRPWYAKYRQWETVLPAVILIGTPLVMISCHLIYFYTAGISQFSYKTFFFTLDGWRAGYSSLGLMLGALLTIYLASLIHRLPVLELYDLYSPGAFVASAIWRVNCFIDGCCYGSPTSVPWGVRFTLIRELNIRTPPSHPVQLYEVIISLMVLLALPLLIKRFEIKPGRGMLTVICLVLYACERFVLEFFRIGGTSHSTLFGMSPTQLFALGIMIVVTAAGIVISRK